jgi:hypothetical protein
LRANENLFRSPFVIPAKAGIHEHRGSSLNHHRVHRFRIKSGMTILPPSPAHTVIASEAKQSSADSDARWIASSLHSSQ